MPLSISPAKHTTKLRRQWSSRTPYAPPCHCCEQHKDGRHLSQGWYWYCDTETMMMDWGKHFSLFFSLPLSLSFHVKFMNAEYAGKDTEHCLCYNPEAYFYLKTISQSFVSQRSIWSISFKKKGMSSQSQFLEKLSTKLVEFLWSSAALRMVRSVNSN